jgi:hypothetical protein
LTKKDSNNTFNKLITRFGCTAIAISNSVVVYGGTIDYDEADYTKGFYPAIMTNKVGSS